MGKAIVKIRFVTWRDGRPRYFASPAHRALGLAGENLRHRDGAWYSLEECLAWSDARAALVAKLTASDTAAARRALLKRELRRGSVGTLFEAFFQTPRLNGVAIVEGKKKRKPLAQNTVDYYRQGATALEKFDGGTIWAASAAALTKKTLVGVFHRLEVLNGLASARRVRASLSAMLSWAVKADRIAANPLLGLALDLPLLTPRVRYGSIAEMGHLVAAADAIGLPEIGDAIALGLWTGQRQNDRLSLTDGSRTQEGIRFVQQKTGAVVLIPEAPELTARLEAARARRAAWRVNYPHILLDEEPGFRRPFAGRNRYGKLFRKVRDAAVRGVLLDGSLGPEPQRLAAAALSGREGQSAKKEAGEWALAPMASLHDFHDQDLRDTAVTWLALAGVTLPGIAAITGHSLETINTILKHYLGLHPELARSAIAALVEWFNANTGERN